MSTGLCSTFSFIQFCSDSGKVSYFVIIRCGPKCRKAWQGSLFRSLFHCWLYGDYLWTGNRAGMTRHVNDLAVVGDPSLPMAWHGGWSLCPPNPYSISGFLHLIAKTEAILSPHKKPGIFRHMAHNSFYPHFQGSIGFNTVNPSLSTGKKSQEQLLLV